MLCTSDSGVLLLVFSLFLYEVSICLLHRQHKGAVVVLLVVIVVILLLIVVVAIIVIL